MIFFIFCIKEGDSHLIVFFYKQNREIVYHRLISHCGQATLYGNREIGQQWRRISTNMIENEILQRNNMHLVVCTMLISLVILIAWYIPYIISREYQNYH